MQSIKFAPSCRHPLLTVSAHCWRKAVVALSIDHVFLICTAVGVPGIISSFLRKEALPDLENKDVKKYAAFVALLIFYKRLMIKMKSRM